MTIVTGASEGIGLELARLFAGAGDDVLLIARSAQALNTAAAGLMEMGSGRIVTLTLDLTGPGAIEAIEAALARENAYADVLVNNAGFGLSGGFTSHGARQVQQMLDLNMIALSALMHHFLPAMLARQRGGILNVASLGGFSPGPYQAAYYASKAFVISLSEALAAEVAGQGVRVAVLAPGPCATEFHGKMGSTNDFYYRFLPQMSAQRAARAGYRGFKSGRRVIIPGFVNNLLALALRIMPHRLAMPIIALLLKPRQQRTIDA